jgi:hypothetical protein
MAILLGFVENINATLELPGAGKFKALKNKSIIWQDEAHYRIYKKVFLRNGQADFGPGNHPDYVAYFPELSLWIG